MSNFISVAALIVSILAFLVSGYVNEQWDRFVNRPAIVPSVVGIKYRQQEFQEQEFDIPDHLRRSSEQAHYFPTLSPKMKRRSLERIINQSDTIDLESASRKLEAALATLNENTSDDEVEEIWSSLRPEDKSILLTMRAFQLIEDKLEKDNISESEIFEIIKHYMNVERNDVEDSESDLLDYPIINIVMEEILYEAARAEFSPTRELILVLLNNEYIQQIKVAAREYEKNISEIKKLLVDTDTNIDISSIWEIDMKFYNKGENVAALFPVAVMSFPKSKTDNLTVFMLAKTSGNIIVPPGEGIDVIFQSTIDNHNNPQFLASLSNNFEIGDRNFKIIFKYLDGEYIESEINSFSKAVFSESVSEFLSKDMLEYARESVKFGVDP